jgi:hypothetical protein
MQERNFANMKFEAIQNLKSSIMRFMRNISWLLEETWYKCH